MNLPGFRLYDVPGILLLYMAHTIDVYGSGYEYVRYTGIIVTILLATKEYAMYAQKPTHTINTILLVTRYEYYLVCGIPGMDIHSIYVHR